MSRHWWKILGLLAISSLAPAVANAQCASCQTGSCNGGWPSQNGRFEGFRQWHADYHQRAAIISQRNNAWPMPFACYDRTAYFATMAAMYESGWIAQCTLTDVHFDATTGQLTEAGRNKLFAIFANNPLDRRVAYVLHDRDLASSEGRLETVRNQISEWYGPALAGNAVLTDRLPQQVSGQRIEAINTQYRSTMPPPMIEMENSNGSVKSSAKN